MSSKGREFLGKVKDVCLAEPLTTKGRIALANMKVDMTEDEFYSSIYVEPFSEYNKEKEDNNNVVQEIDSDVDQNCYQDIIELNFLQNMKIEFEKAIMELNDALFVIKGVAGSGKTTYLHRLLRDIVDKTQVHIYNFEEVRQSNAFMAAYFDLEKLYEDNVYKFLSILLMEISKILSKGKNTQEEHYEFVEEITNIYKTHFQVTEEELINTNLLETNVDIREQQELFDTLKQYVERKIDYEHLSKILLEKFLKRFNSNKTDSITDLAYISGFIIRLYFCVSQITSKKQLCVVDNIETFVTYDEQHPIQQCELERILLGCYNAAVKVREILVPLQKVKGYNTFYGFLIVTRETTASTALRDLDHFNDFKKENEIDISGWFCTEEIFENKRDFCQKRGAGVESNCYFECYQNILCDFSLYRWGLNGILSKMYKHSHRRNAECVPEAISVIPESEIIYFNNLWKETYSKTAHTSGLKTLCRKYILRILLDNVQRKQYFDKIMVENLDLDYDQRNLANREKILGCKLHKNESNSYARKIATILHRCMLEYGKETYISFPRLIEAVLKRPYKPNYITDNQIENLGKILFLMNETRNEITNWTSLVCIKYDSKEIYNEKELCKNLINEWHDYIDHKKINIDDTSRFGVQITDAGSLFAKILADFEYFACRFLSKEPPLFSKENIKTIYVNRKKSFRAVEIINIVREKAFICIDEIIEKDLEFFSDPGNNSNRCPGFSSMYRNRYSWVYKDSINAKLLVHPYRILTQHQGYLSNYISYVESYISEEEFENKECKGVFLSKVKEQLTKYNERMYELMNKYPNYFKV
ncbi:MAG: hypothetical protein J6K58_00830 [Lachnospiraceae bacterium]|nr:hypothetical protein [Lachnospiraceae bacterium]